VRMLRAIKFARGSAFDIDPVAWRAPSASTAARSPSARRRASRGDLPPAARRRGPALHRAFARRRPARRLLPEDRGALARPPRLARRPPRHGAARSPRRERERVPSNAVLLCVLLAPFVRRGGLRGPRHPPAAGRATSASSSTSRRDRCWSGCAPPARRRAGAPDPDDASAGSCPRGGAAGGAGLLARRDWFDEALQVLDLVGRTVGRLRRHARGAGVARRRGGRRRGRGGRAPRAAEGEAPRGRKRVGGGGAAGPCRRGRRGGRGGDTGKRPTGRGRGRRRTTAGRARRRARGATTSRGPDRPRRRLIRIGAVRDQAIEAPPSTGRTTPVSQSASSRQVADGAGDGGGESPILPRRTLAAMDACSRRRSRAGTRRAGATALTRTAGASSSARQRGELHEPRLRRGSGVGVHPWRRRRSTMLTHAGAEAGGRGARAGGPAQN